MQFAKDRAITAFKIENEGEILTFKPWKEGEEPTQRLVVGVSYNGSKTGDPNKWKVANSTKDTLIEFFGKHTKDWVGKEIDIQIVAVKDNDYIAVDQLRLRARYPNN